MKLIIAFSFNPPGPYAAFAKPIKAALAGVCPICQYLAETISR